MNYELPIIANASSVEGRVFVVRGGVEQALLPDMALQADDVIPVVGDLLGGLTSSISSTGGAEGGLLGGLPLIGDLTRGLS
jgi:hypothetical protein